MIFDRICYFALAAGLLLLNSCARPPAADLMSYLPHDALIYAETGDLESVTRIFTENPDWKRISPNVSADLSFLKNKRAAIAVTGFHNNDNRGERVLEVKPQVVMLVDTGSSPANASALAENLLKRLSLQFFGGSAEPVKTERDGTTWISVEGGDERKIFAGISGSVILIGNDEAVIADCIGRRKGNGASLSQNEALKSEREQRSPETIAFGYLSNDGVRELSNYLGVSYAIKTSENSIIRGMITDILPRVLGETVKSVTWTAKSTGDRIEDTFFIRTERSVADSIFQTVKAGAVKDSDNSFVPVHADSVSFYSFAEPQIAWRGAVLSFAAKLDARDLAIFREFSQGLLRPYGVDDPEMFLGAVDRQITTIRFDRDGERAAAIVKVKDGAAIKRSLSENFDFNAKPGSSQNAEIWQRKDEEFAAAFTAGYLVLGDVASVQECLRARDGAGLPGSFPVEGAIINTRQKDLTARAILSGIAQDNTDMREEKYSFTQTRIEALGISRRTTSAFGAFGELYRQIMP